MTEDVGKVLDDHLREFVELKGIVLSHIQACQETRRVIFTLSGLVITLAIAIFGYSVHIIDTLRDEQSNYGRMLVLLQKRADDVNEDVTNRLTTIVTASVQRESITAVRITELRSDLMEIRKELKDEINRLRK